MNSRTDAAVVSTALRQRTRKTKPPLVDHSPYGVLFSFSLSLILGFFSSGRFSYVQSTHTTLGFLALSRLLQFENRVIPHSLHSPQVFHPFIRKPPNVYKLWYTEVVFYYWHTLIVHLTLICFYHHLLVLSHVALHRTEGSWRQRSMPNGNTGFAAFNCEGDNVTIADRPGVPLLPLLHIRVGFLVMVLLLNTPYNPLKVPRHSVLPLPSREGFLPRLRK
ncbi:hypothetical protein VTO42DRAFT_346 [Malbranchea cinnamomea]